MRILDDAERSIGGANSERRDGGEPRDDAGRQATSGAGIPDETLPDTSREGLPLTESEAIQRQGGHDEGRAVTEFRRALPAFPPGPADREGWRRILRWLPWLAPASEPDVRFLVDGLAMVVDENRADALRAGGNGVVARQGAVMFTILRRRAQERIKNG